jgi:hypothetical protein
MKNGPAFVFVKLKNGIRFVFGVYTAPGDVLWILYVNIQKPK